MGIEKPQIKNPKVRFVKAWSGGVDYPAKLFCFYVNDATISGL